MPEELTIPYDSAQPPAKILRAGSLSCLYEDGKLRYVTTANVELVRNIYCAVRLQDWETVPYTIHDERIEIHFDSFHISYTAIYAKEKELVKAEFQVEGKPDNSIIFSVKATVQAGFAKNRIGLCVLHPLKECKGRDAAITDPEGRIDRTAFPNLIKPHHAFNEVCSIEWLADGKVPVRIDFQGEIFETEDQRNWSDASFKTYSTPQRIPFPVLVKAGDVIEHRVAISVSLPGNTGSKLESLQEQRIPFPEIGCCKMQGHRLSAQVAEKLMALPIEQYRVSIQLQDPGWHQLLREALEDTQRLKARLALVVAISQDFDEIRRLTDFLVHDEPVVKSILLVDASSEHSTDGRLRDAYYKIKEKLRGVLIGYGSDGHFADLNRNRPSEDTPFDFVSFPITPQAHCFDNRSILENLESLPDMIATAREFAQGRPIHISPLSLKSRTVGQTPDPRAHSWFAASWVLHCIQNLSEAASIDIFDLLSEQHGDLLSLPIFEVLSIIRRFEPVSVIRRFHGDGTILMDGLLLENKDGKRLHLRGPHQ